MQTLRDLEAARIPIEEEEHRHAQRLLAGIVCALVLTGGLFGGYLFLRKRHERELAAANAANQKAEKVAPKVEVFIDEATLKGKETLLGGTVHNLSTETFHRVAVEMELRRRPNNGLEKRLVALDPPELAPDARAHYALSLLARDYTTAQLVRVVAGDNAAEVPFRALKGEPRPLEPGPSPKTIVVNRPPARGEQFINSPSHPDRIP